MRSWYDQWTVTSKSFFIVTVKTKRSIGQADLTQMDASSNPQQRSRHVVKWNGDVDDVLRCGSTDLEEHHTADGF